MRSKNAIKNLVFYLGYEALVFVLGIVFPRYIILYYGSEINGLTSTITRILSLINLIQAGAVGAAIFQMYKPVADEDYETQSAILYSSKRYYKKITVVYFVLAVACGVFYGFYLQSPTLAFWEILISFLILAVNGAGTLTVRAICDIYVSPHQKKYYLTIGQIAEQVVRYACVVVVLVLHWSFVHLYLAYLLGGAVGLGLNYYFYRKLSDGKITDNPADKDYRIPDKSYLMMQSIGSEAVTASPAILITTFVSLVQSSVFSVYSMIFTSMKTILNSLQLSFSAIFGNLVKTADDAHIYSVYDRIELATLMLGAILSACVGFLLEPFIRLYTSGVTDAEYLYPILIVFVVCYTAIFSFRTAFSYVATVYGLFKKTCKITLLFGGIGIFLSAVCVILFGMPYVMCGLLFNQLGCAIAILFALKKDVRWFSTNHLLRRTVVLILMAAAGLGANDMLPVYISSWTSWIVCGFLSALSAVAVTGVYCVFFERRQLLSLIGYAKSLFRRRTANR